MGHADANFAFCVHVGTSASENIKTSRAGFMEGRVKTLVDALADQGLEVDSANSFEHFKSTRFAGLGMKVYTGEEAPGCNQDDLIPPPAGSLVEVGSAMREDPVEETVEEEEEEVTMIPVDDTDEVTVEAGEAADLFIVGEDTAPVKKAQEDDPEAGVVAIAEIRTKLRFIGNKVDLRNPEMVPTLVGDINEQKEKHADAKFAFCVHVGTSASENIKTSRAGFMEGRVKTLVDALADQGLEVSSANAFEHFKSTRFAGLVMKVYTGEEAPGCNQDDLIPPPAGSLLQVGVHEDPVEETVEEEEEVTMIPVDDTDEVTVEAGEAADLFIVGEDTAPVKKAQEDDPEAGVVAIA